MTFVPAPYPNIPGPLSPTTQLALQRRKYPNKVSSRNVQSLEVLLIIVDWLKLEEFCSLVDNIDGEFSVLVRSCMETREEFQLWYLLSIGTVCETGL
jgi:hypothetical protein